MTIIIFCASRLAAGATSPPPVAAIAALRPFLKALVFEKSNLAPHTPFYTQRELQWRQPARSSRPSRPPGQRPWPTAPALSGTGAICCLCNREAFVNAATGGSGFDYWGGLTRLTELVQPVCDAIHQLESDRPLLSEILPKGLPFSNINKSLKKKIGRASCRERVSSPV